MTRFLQFFTSRYRSFLIFDLIALGVVLALALTVYAFKTFAGAERSNIAEVESQIRDETRQVLLLKAQIAHLESPDRLERLATGVAKEQPVSAKQEVSPAALSTLAARPEAPANAAPPAATNEAGQ